ncbi:MAG: M23 family metallopeptidase [Desulfovibrio sp.]|nr:M23 family metallopeptidase [Desulfovibrio sp.]
MRKRGIFTTVLSAILILVFGSMGYMFFKDLSGPEISVSPDTGKVSNSTVLRVAMEDPSGVRSLIVGIRKNNTLNEIYNKHFDSYLPKRIAEVPLKDVNLRQGGFELEIRATDGSMAGFGQGNTRTELINMRMDNQPPRVSLKNLPPNVRRGGAGVIRYTTDEEVSRTGVLIKDYFVPGYLQKDGSYLCFFPFPYTMTAREFKSSIKILAADLAGNETIAPLNVMAFERTFRNDKLDLSDNFLQVVENKLKHLAPDAPDPLRCYLYINKEVRAADAQMLENLKTDTSAAMLWDGVFLRMPRSAPRAGFADHRLIFYKGKQVGDAYHLGFDLASVRNDNVPAANNGRVIFTGEQGIYGNLAVIDHGLGLMSLYSHMSEIIAKAGDIVEKGQIIGKTGTTGLAFGDHLHFGIMVGGKEVTPLEWIDAKWIKDNVTKRIGEDLQK